VPAQSRRSEYPFKVLVQNNRSESSIGVAVQSPNSESPHHVLHREVALSTFLIRVQARPTMLSFLRRTQNDRA